MHKNDKIKLTVSFIVTLISSYAMKLDYNSIADVAITVASIVIAVYISVATVLLGSEYAEVLAKKVDSQKKTNSLLGSLAEYLREGGKISMLTLVLSCLYKFPAVIQSNLWNQFVSALSCSILACNFLFLWLIFSFIVNSLTKAARIPSD